MIITLASLKGGVGKTTSAIHLAQYLASVKGEKTVLLDNDPSQYAIGYDLNSESKGLAFDVLPMAAAMNKVGNYAHVVIDTEARPSDDDIANYAKGCDLLIVPTTPAAMPLKGLGMLSAKLDGAANWRSLLTMAPPHPSKQTDDAREALTAAEIPVFDTVIPRAAAFDHASKTGVPVYEWDARGREVWKAYEAIGREIDAILG